MANQSGMNTIINETSVRIPVGSIELMGDLAIPQRSIGLVLFAHGSGSSRLSPRNQAVASLLNRQGITTLLFDLLSYAEDREYSNRFNVSQLAHRLVHVTRWVAAREDCKDLPVGYFGASTGAAAALLAAAEMPNIAAVVSRGGRPDLASKALPQVQAPVLLIVGGEDADVLQLNRQAFEQLTGEKKLAVIPGATHLFEEEGAMEQVCALATAWFEKHFQPSLIF